MEETAIAVLEQQGWRGNFRELDQVMERILMLYRTGNRVRGTDARAAFDRPATRPR